MKKFIQAIAFILAAVMATPWMPPDLSVIGTAEAASMTGSVKRIIVEKGIGFIVAGNGVEYFFHRSAMATMPFEDLREGMDVTFDVGQGPKGPRAENIRPI